MWKERWRATLGDRRLLGMLALAVAASLALLATPLAGRAWLLLAWSVFVYFAGTVVWTAWRPSPPPSKTETSPPASPVTTSGTPEPLPTVSEPQPRGSALLGATEDALRKMNNPAALGDCRLAGLLPLTLRQVTDPDGSGHRLALHQALRITLVHAIDRLKPTEAAGPSEGALSYAILHDEYVLGHSTARIMTRHSISESTFHRHRRDAIQAVAQDLATQEEELRRTGT